MWRYFIGTLFFVLCISASHAAEAGNCFGPKVLERVIGGGHVDYDRFFTMCPGTAIISIDTYGTNPTVGLFIQAGSSGPIVCDRRFASDSHTCTFTVHQRQRFYVRVINYAHHGVPYRFISN